MNTDKIQQYQSIIRENNAIIEALCKEYNSIFVIRYNENKFIALSIAEQYRYVLDKTDCYEEGLNLYCDNYVSEKDRERIKEFGCLENISVKLEKNEVVETTYQLTDNSWMSARYIEITDTQKPNAERAFLVGIIRYNKEMQALQYEKQANEVISALSENYQVVYRINMKSGEYENILTKSDIRRHKAEYKSAFDMQKFYENNGFIKKVFIGKEGEELKESTFSLEEMRAYFEKNSEPVEIFLMEYDGKWIKFYAAKDKNYTDELPYVILAIRECNEQIVSRTHSIINRLAISMMYQLAVIIDIENDSFECLHSATKEIMPVEEGKLDVFLDRMKELVFEEDYEKFINMFYGIQNNNNAFTECEFRAEDGRGMFHYVNGFSAYICVPDGGKILCLLRYIDEKVANREKISALNHDYDIARKMITSLGEAYYAIYYIQVESFYMLPVRERNDFAASAVTEMDYRSVLENYIKKFVVREDRTIVNNFANLENVSKLMSKEGDRIYAEYRRNMDGNSHWVRMEIQVIKVVDGKVTEVVAAFKDIHDERKNEILQKQALTDALENAKAANTAKTEFLSNMSHDIRTPMNAVMGMTEIALRHFDDKEKVHSCLVRIEESSKHLLRLVNEVLDMSYIESGRTIINTKPFSLKKALDSIIAITQNQIKEKKQNFHSEYIGIKSDNYLGDEVRINQIIINVIGNAVKYTPEGGDIYFTVEQKADICPTVAVFVFKIRDTGKGMSEEFQKKVFKPFEREHNTTIGKTEGTGLGMTISKELVEMMGGSIMLESEINKGSTFTITLPIQYDSRAALAEEQKRDEEHITLRYDFTGKRILVVDDNEINRDIACDFLEDVNATIDCASDGVEAYEKIRDGEKYDAILMDVRMPVMSGYEATAKIRKIKTEYAEKVPIIAMTANAFVEDEMESRQIGMNDHITKPIDCEVLYASLNKLMSQISE